MKLHQNQANPAKQQNNAHTGSAHRRQGRGCTRGVSVPQCRTKAVLRSLGTLMLSLVLVCTLGMVGFATEAQAVRYEGQNNSNYSDYNSQGGSSYNSSDILLERIGMGVLTGAVVAGVFCFICVRQLKTAVRQHSASDYVTGNGLRLTDRRDLYLFSNTVRRRRENSQGGRGGHGGRGGPDGGPGGFGGGPGFGGGGGPRGGGGRR